MASVDTDIPVYDISGWCFMHNVSNFNLESVYHAIQSIGVNDRKHLRITVPSIVYDQLDASGQIYHNHKEGLMKFHLFDLDIDESGTRCGNVFDSLITAPNGKQVILRSREL